MAIDMKYAGVAGDVTESGHEKWIEISSLSLGASNPPGGGSGLDFMPQTVSMTKSLDVSTAPLMRALVDSNPLPATIDITSLNREGEIIVIARYLITGATVTRFSSSADGDGRPTEELELSWQLLEFVFEPSGRMQTANWSSKSK